MTPLLRVLVASGLLVGAAVTNLGCDGGPAARAFVTRDSARITIAESTAPLWDEGEEWRIRAEPEVVIGQAEGAEPYVLHQVLGARRFADGRIAILDRGSSRVRIYDAAGRHLLDAGGPGGGPAEFTSPQYVDLVADTIVVYQFGPPTLSWFNARGDFVRRVRLTGFETGPPSGAACGMLGGDAIVIAANPRARFVPRPGPARESKALWRLPLDGSGGDSLGQLDTDEIVVDTDGGWNQLVFGKTTYCAASRDRIYVGATDAYSIQVLDPEGKVQRIIRKVAQPRRVTDADITRCAEQMVAALYRDPESVPVIARNLREIGTAEFMPAFRMVVVDADDNLWVEDWDDVGIDQGAFSVFRPDGAWLGRVRLPAGLPMHRARNLWTSILDIGKDYVLGVWLGELGMEQVRMYRIGKGPIVEK